MNRNDIRVTYAVDAQTVAAIDRLAREWDVSRSEAVRRAVRMASERADVQISRMTPMEILEYVRKHPRRTKKEIAEWQREARRLRKSY